MKVLRPRRLTVMVAGVAMFIGAVILIDQFADMFEHSTAKSVSYLHDRLYSSADDSTCIAQSDFETQPQDVIRQRFEQRRVAVRDTCKRIQQRSSLECEIQNVKINMKSVTERGIVFCAIEKTGSTFWKKILHVAGGWGNTSNPLDISPEQVYSARSGFRTLTDSTWDEMENIFDKSTAIMCVRDPFTRMFSGWLDKFYSTNPDYWKNVGTKIIKQERKNATEMSLRCGHDVTFPEFANYIVRRLKSDSCFDGHFLSNYIHCLPCNLTFQYIVKYETLKEDTNFLLNELNLSSRIHFSDFENDADNAAILDSVQWVFKMKPEIVNCISFRCGLFRVWKRLQSRGIISKTIEFPYSSNDEANAETVDGFKAKIEDAHDRSDLNDVKQNRQEVLAMAFRSLSQDELKNMLETLEIDFEMFGYDRVPEFLKIVHSEKNEYIQMCPFD